MDGRCSRTLVYMLLLATFTAVLGIPGALRAAGTTDLDEEATVGDPGEQATVGDPGEKARIGDPGEKARIGDPGEKKSF